MADKANKDYVNSEPLVSQEESSSLPGRLVSGVECRMSALGMEKDEDSLSTAVSQMSIEDTCTTSVRQDLADQETSTLTQGKLENESESSKESNTERVVENPEKYNKPKEPSKELQSLECCPICLQPPVHPVELPCKHVFCFLCLKGMAARDLRCGLCRAPFPREFIVNPMVVGAGQPRLSDLTTTSSEENYSWFYQSRSSGWWLYEERVSRDIEEAFLKKVPKTRVYISGYQYIIDFDSMVQYRELYPDRIRRIKRDKCAPTNIKGVAGIKVSNN